MKKVFQSSADANKLALTIKGVLVGLIPVFLFVFEGFGLDIGRESLLEFIQQLTAIVAGVMTVIGLVRKFIIKIKNQING